MKNIFLMFFMYAFWFGVFFSIYWLVINVNKWDKMQQKQQQDFQRSK